MKTAYIYAITLRQTCDSYVGITIDLLNRWRWHVNSLRGNLHTYPALQSAWDQYGWAAFDWHVLEIVSDIHSQSRPQVELAWIRRIGTLNSPDCFGDFSISGKSRFFEAITAMQAIPEIAAICAKQKRRAEFQGLTPEGRELRRQKHVARMASEQERRKQSEKMKAYWASPAAAEHRAYLSRDRSEESRTKQSESLKQLWADPERNQALLESRKHMPAEARKRQGEGMRRHWAENRDEMLQKIREGQKASGRWSGEDARAKASETTRTLMANPETKAKAIAGVKASWADPAIREKRLAAIRAHHAAKKSARQSQPPDEAES